MTQTKNTIASVMLWDADLAHLEELMARWGVSRSAALRNALRIVVASGPGCATLDSAPLGVVSSPPGPAVSVSREGSGTL